MKTLKKSLSLLLAVCILASVAAIATVSASANAGDPIRRLDIAEVVKGVDTNTYRFYMPAEWRNEFNDNYDGSDLASCTAGIYWWEGDFNCETEDYKVDGNGWPGFAIKKTDEADKNIFVCDVPKTVSTILFNNLVNGTNDKTNPAYTKAIQTSNVPAEYYDPGDDGYGFYPEGTDASTGFDGMIYVCNPKAIEINEYSQKATYKGVWFYYYGEGKYGIYKTLQEAEAAGEVLQNGEFPAYDVDIDTKEVSVEVGKTAEIQPNQSDVTVEVADPTVASYEKDAVTGKVTVKGLKAGTTKITFKATVRGVEKSVEATVTVKEAKTTVSAKAAKSTIYVKQTTKVTPTVKNGKGTTTYSSSNTKVATVDKSGKVTAKKAGTATIKVTNNKVSASVKITVKNPTVTISSKSIKVKKTAKITVKNAVGKVTYKTSNKKIATVKNGKVTGKKKGKATITVTASGVKFTFKVTVKK